jgi:hypothetical protein
LGRCQDSGDITSTKALAYQYKSTNTDSAVLQARARGMKVRDIATKKMLAVAMPTEFQQGVSRNIFH